MKRCLYQLVLLGVVLLGACGILRAQEEREVKPVEAPPVGSLAGTVVDESGAAVARATVYAIPEGLRRVMTQSDDSGKFTLKDLPPGNVRVYAYKDRDGYPDPFSWPVSIGREKARQAARIFKDKTTSGITLVLGPKAPVLTGTLVDQVTGRPVRATITLNAPDDPRLFYHAGALGQPDAAFRVLAATTPFRMKATADGYQDWHYGGDQWQTEAGLIQLSPGAELRLEIKLQPVKK
jgi:hypothetical protein